MASEMRPEPVKATALLLKLRGSNAQGMGIEAQNLARGAELLFETEGGTASFGVADDPPAQWVRIGASDNPWDQAHAMMRAGFAVGSGDLLAAEPDFEQQWVGSGPAGVPCEGEAQNGGGGRAVGPRDRWHLDAEFSALRVARDTVAHEAQQRILIAHLDTGYYAKQKYRPAHLDPRERNFVKGEGSPNSAQDVTPGGGFLRNRGHGTGTIGILAAPEIGGAPGARVLPIRIADGVVRFRTGTMAQGFDYAQRMGAHVLSMSMGGLASAILADAVNKCYASGMVMVTAAGNNFSRAPIGSIVYPARMRRVVAACGIMADLRPYAGLKLGTMEGCYGPASKMLTALSAFTPNIPWPQIGCPDTIDEDGQGTSAATPQIASAAALWLAHHWDQIERYPEAWMRGEAARQALFRSAALAGQAAPDAKLGWGALRATLLLKQHPLPAAQLHSETKATAAWAWLKLLTGQGTGFAAAGLADADRLLTLELVQLAQRDDAVAKAIADPDADTVRPAARRRLLEAAEASPLTSRALKAALGQALVGKRPATPVSAPDPETAPPVSEGTPPERAAKRRKLRIFAVDPSLGGSLNSYRSQIATIEIRNEPDLQPGPVGEYLEVVDIDPASNRFYPPVNLNEINVALDDGLKPSEGNPQFHQQMTYAVAMRTIENFEIALGRKALWTSRWSGQTGDDNKFVKRLRIFPHALRQENAYYSPAHQALLFGYFPARSRVSALTPSGTMVFSCLSSDIIAHETTHALLDGQAKTMREPSNPDVRAFHEAFADIVAVFQQYTYRDLVHREIAQACGDLTQAGFLGAIGGQFGESTGRNGPLRRYGKPDPDIRYATTFDTHKRGSLLVAAVYQAFLAIVEQRTVGLIRLATGGSGILPAGELHPELVDRLTDETIKAAQHVLRMCIRAIDYCPPVDLTFGEYLRAIITADLEEVPDDRFEYRIAFVEAFRRFELLPRNLRTVSVESLTWNSWNGEQPLWLEGAMAAAKLDLGRYMSRKEIFDKSEEQREDLRVAILKGLSSQAICDQIGLQHGLPYFRSIESKGYQSGTTFMVYNVRLAKRVRECGELAAQLIVVLRQRRPESLSPALADEQPERFWFRGGATLIIDLLGPDGPKIRYAIVKPIMSASRLARERDFRLGDTDSFLRETYFGRDGFAEREPFAIIHGDRELS